MRTAIFKMRTLLSLFWDALKGKEQNFVEGSINRTIALLSVPMVAELFMESVFICAILFFVSKLGANAIAIAGATTSFITFCYSVSIGLGIAASAMVSRRIGEGKPQEAGKTAIQVIYIALPLAGIISLICSAKAAGILTLMGLSPAMVKEGQLYAQIMFACCGFLLLRIVINGIFRGAGDASTAMCTLWLSNGINILLCPILMFGWGVIPSFGLLGVGAATGFARLAGVCYQVWHLRKGKTMLKIDRSSLVFDYSTFKKVIRLALGGTLQFIIPASSWVLMIKIISHFGENALSGYILAHRVASFGTIPAWGIGNAAGILTGQNLGAGKPARAEKSVWRAGFIAMSFLILVAITWIFLADPVVRIFTDIPAIISHSTTYIHIISMAYVLLGFTMVISRALNAAGEVTVVTLLYVIMFYLTQLPLSYLFGVHLNLGPNGVFIAILISELVLATSCIWVFRRGKWKQTKV